MGRDIRYLICYGIEITKYYAYNKKNGRYIVNKKETDEDELIKLGVETINLENGYSYLILDNVSITFNVIRSSDSILEFGLKFDDNYKKFINGIEENKEKIINFCLNYNIDEKPMILELMIDR